jgi:phosphoribosylformylglycinamidine cyclo-ligase
LGRTLGEELLEPHRCYYNQLKPLLPFIKGIAHITGGGLIDNVPRVLPEGLTARFHSQSWTIPTIFRLIQQQGNVAPDEMYRVFNMGVGMALICSTDNIDRLTEALPEAKVIGEVVKQAGKDRVIIE